MNECQLGLEPDTHEYQINHSWEASRNAAKARDGYACVKCGSGQKLEVNHIDPRWGNTGPGCQHHQDNMETLCKKCHRLVTMAQMMRVSPSSGMRVRTDARKRLNLGPWKSPHTLLYVVERGDGGAVTLRPAVLVTDPEVVSGS